MRRFMPHPRRGALVIVIALVTVSVLLVISTTMLLLGSISSRPSIDNRHRLQAREAMSSGAQAARTYLRAYNSVPGTSPDAPLSTPIPPTSPATAHRVALGNACYSYWFGPYDSTTAYVHVVAISPYRPPLSNCDEDAEQLPGVQIVSGTFELDHSNDAALASIVSAQITDDDTPPNPVDCDSSRVESPSGSGTYPSDLRDVPCYADAVLADNPALYWRLADTGSTTAEDASPNNRDGTFGTAGNWLQDQPGALRDGAGTRERANTTVSDASNGNQSVQFQPANAQSYVGGAFSGPPTASGATTIEAWIWWDGTAGSPMQIMGFGSDTLMWTNANGGVLGYSPSGNATDYLGVPFPAAQWQRQWVHVALVINVSGAAAAKLYINGQPYTMSVSGGSPGSASSAINSSFRISGSTPASSSSFAGRIDEVAVYEGELAADRILAHYQAR